MTSPAHKVPLLAIRPDPDQPRSLLPVDLVGLFTNGLMTPQAIMSEWQKYPNSQLAGIITLALSIAQHGQINPISVQPAQGLPGVEYLIVTGERRWWAHVLLLVQGRDIYEGNTRNPADQIKISLVTKGVSIRAHQLIENVVREDLCAVEKAHGMWALRYELSGKNFSSILPTSAQEKYLVGWDQVEKSLGVSNRYRQYVTGVLRLTPDALKLVAEHSLSESTIRPITQKLHKYPDLQMQALRQLVALRCDDANHSLVKEVKQLVERLVADIPQVGSTPRPSLLPPAVSTKKNDHTPKTKQEVAPAPDSTPSTKHVYAAKSIPTPPAPELLANSASQNSDPVPVTYKLYADQSTLRSRPRHAKNLTLEPALTKLIETLSQMSSLTDNQRKKLITLQEKIESLTGQIS